MNERRDELASAWLDGELSDAELASWDDEADLHRARDELALVRERLRAPVPTPQGLAETQITVALERSTTRADAGVGVVVTLGSSSRRRSSRPAVWLGRAAAVAVLVGGMGLGATALSRTVDGPANETASGDATSEQAGSGEEAFAAASIAEDGSATGRSADPAAQDGAATGGSADSAAEDEAATGGSADSAAESSGPATAATEEGGAATPGVAPGTISAAATELVSEGPVGAEDLRRQLEERFGPAQDWPADSTEGSGCGRRSPSGQAVDDRVAVPLTRDGAVVELVVPPGEQAYFADPVNCQPVP